MSNNVSHLVLASALVEAGVTAQPTVETPAAPVKRTRKARTDTAIKATIAKKENTNRVAARNRMSQEAFDAERAIMATEARTKQVVKIANSAGVQDEKLRPAICDAYMVGGMAARLNPTADKLTTAMIEDAKVALKSLNRTTEKDRKGGKAYTLKGKRIRSATEQTAWVTVNRRWTRLLIACGIERKANGNKSGKRAARTPSSGTATVTSTAPTIADRTNPNVLAPKVDSLADVVTFQKSLAVTAMQMINKNAALTTTGKGERPEIIADMRSAVDLFHRAMLRCEKALGAIAD